jgi:putative transposase
MDKNSTTDAGSLFAGEAWFDPIEAELRERVRGFLEEMIEQEATAALGRSRYQRGTAAGYRNGRRSRRLLGSFGPIEIAVPRAGLLAPDGTSRERQSAVLPRYARMTKPAEALIASAYLAGTNTRRVKRGLAALFKGAVSKDIVSRVWRKVKTDWEAWPRRDLAQEDIVRLVLDGSVVRVRLDRKATNISLLVVLGIRRDGQKILLAVRHMGGESEAAWRGVLDDLIARGLRTPEFLIIDGAAGLEKALAALWPEVPTQRCTVHKHRNLLAHAPDALHEEISADYTDMIYGKTAKEIEARRRAFLRKWRLKCRAVADSLEEAGDRLFTFTRLPESHMWTAPSSQGFPCKHQLPSDTRDLIGQRHGGQLRRLALEKRGKPGRRPSATSNVLDHGGSPDHQHAAQSLVAGSRDDAGPNFACGRMILRRQADPGRELPARSE